MHLYSPDFLGWLHSRPTCLSYAKVSVLGGRLGRESPRWASLGAGSGPSTVATALGMVLTQPPGQPRVWKRGADPPGPTGCEPNKKARLGETGSQGQADKQPGPQLRPPEGSGTIHHVWPSRYRRCACVSAAPHMDITVAMKSSSVAILWQFSGKRIIGFGWAGRVLNPILAFRPSGW